MSITLRKVFDLLKDKGIFVLEMIDNTKASEKYIRTTFIQDDGFEWSTVIPYYIRRSGLFLESEEEIAEYFISLKPYFTPEKMQEWRNREKAKWDRSNAIVTREFFYKLLSFKEETEFPANDNPARRIQDIKDAGYTLASIPRSVQGKTSRILLPIPLTTEMGYETFSPQFKARVIRLLHGRNSYEAKETSRKALIPDHKFSEIRCDEETKAENSMEMTDEEIIQKFQLLDNQRNQQKREVCRKCFQDGVRGNIFGINYYYRGNDRWDPSIPTVGKMAEKGCEGCPWYDIELWRTKLNEKINDRN